MSEDDPFRAGVVGVGSMGQHHARTYDDVGGVELVGVYDADRERAETVATQVGTEARDLDSLLETADGVSVAVPTQYHHDIARQAIDAGVHVLVEKPFVEDPSDGRDLISRAELAEVTLQVGHVERFNPVVEALQRIVPDLDLVAASAERLGPPPERTVPDTAVMDLMIHDVDILRTLFDGTVTDYDARGAADGRYAVGTLEFDTGLVCDLTASRVTQETVRRITLSARSCRVKADLVDGTVEIHRDAAPESTDPDGPIPLAEEDVLERLSLEDRDPLSAQLSSFVQSAQDGTPPRVTGDEALRVLELTRAIDRAQAGGSPVAPHDPA